MERVFSRIFPGIFPPNIPCFKHVINCIIELYERAIKGVMKESHLLYFAYADFEEERRNFEDVKKIYNRLLELENVDPTLVSRHTFVNNMNIFLLITFCFSLIFN